MEDHRRLLKAMESEMERQNCHRKSEKTMECQRISWKITNRKVQKVIEIMEHYRSVTEGHRKQCTGNF